MLRHGVVAVTAPGMTAQDAAQRQVEALYGAMLLKRLNSILATGGGEAA